MKKSNKVSLFYVISSVSLLLLLIGDGIYGIYLSIGLSFVRNGISNITQGSAMNVSYGGNINFSSSMIGVIILSIILILISIFDLITLLKQIIFFKQFKLIRESNFEKKVEKKVKSKSKVVFFTIIIDIISFLAGIIGIFVNLRTFPELNLGWLLYVIDGLVSIFAVINIVLLIIKLKQSKKLREKIDMKLNENEKENEELISKIDEIFSKKKEDDNVIKVQEEMEENDVIESQENIKKHNEKQSNFDKSSTEEDNLDFDIDDIEYKLLKLRQLRTTRMISLKEYDRLRSNILGMSDLIEENNSTGKKEENILDID